MTINPLSLCLLCTVCTALGYLIGKMRTARKALQLVIDISHWN